ncbi:MAG: LysR family transcriptional regulator [Hyphomicrobiaceae bacterium]
MKNLSSPLAMDWDKLRIFHAAAEAGSFTHAGDVLNMSQSAVSRQVSALERELKVSLFHRHARGLVLTEQGELLFRAAHDVFVKLQSTAAELADTKAKPSGELRVTLPVGLGSAWLAPRIGEFIDLYPDISLRIIFSDEELDLSMREADIAIWLREPSQNDLIRRPLFPVHLHAFASSTYLKRFGEPKGIDDLANHRIITYGGPLASQTREINWLETVGREAREPRRSYLTINNIYGLKQAVRRGVGIAVLPDYLANDDVDLVPILDNVELPEWHCYFVYPEELKNSKRVQVFRDYLVAKARQWKS